MSVFVAILLGLLQGATVFLPVSYSGHQAIFQNLLKVEVPEQGPYVFLMNLSTLVSILLVYRKDVMELVREGADFLRGRTQEDPLYEGRMSPAIRMLYFIIVGTVPLLLSIPINNHIDILLNSAAFIGAAMLAMGVLLFVTDRFIKTGKRTEKTMTTKDAVFIGLGQAMAVIPGISRIGAAMSIGLARGMGKEFIIRYSIFLSLPSVALAIIISFFSLFRGGEWAYIFVYLIAFIISVITGYFSIQILRLVTRRRRLRRFSYYLWAAGILAIILSFAL